MLCLCQSLMFDETFSPLFTAMICAVSAVRLTLVYM